MTVLDIPHHFTNTPSILAGCLVVTWLVLDSYLVLRNWRHQ